MELFPYELTKISDRFAKRWAHLESLQTSPNAKFTQQCLSQMRERLRQEEINAVEKFCENYRNHS